MYIRKRTRRGHEYYAVVEGERIDGTVRQHQVQNIGRIDKMTPERRVEIEDKLSELDEGRELLQDFRELLIEEGYNFSDDEIFQAGHQLEELTPKRAVDYGPVAALHTVAQKLELESVLERHLQPKGGGPPLGKLLLLQIIGHCVEPRSINKIPDWYSLTALPGLLDLPADQLSTDVLYNSLDYITEEGIENIHEELWRQIQNCYETPEQPLFYDLTSSYFEGTECPITDYGYSSENRPDKQQIVVGVTVNPDMIPLQHEVYPGNTTHSETVDDAAGRVVEHGINDPVLVMDKGCANTPNREDLREGELITEDQQVDYVAPLKNDGDVPDLLASIETEEFDSVERPEGASPLAVKEITPPEDVAAGGARWIATYNEAKAKADADSREDKLAKAGEALDKLVDRQYGDQPLSKKDLRERIENKLSNTIQDLLVIEINERGPPRLSWEIDEEAVDEAAKLDGKAMFETTRAAEDLSAAAVAQAYRDRDTVEKFMESIKDMAHLRPHHVYTEQHVRARVFVCVLSVLLLAVLQLELAEAGKDMTGINALETLRGLRRVEFSIESEEAVIVRTTELSEEQEELAHVFDLST